MFDPAPPRIAEIAPDQEDLGLRLALAGLDPNQWREQVAALRRWVERQLLSGYRILGASRAEKLAGAILMLTQPGRTAIVWPPRLVAGEPKETGQELLRAGVTHLRQRGTRLLQALLPAAVGADAESLAAAGFQHASDLLYLVCLADHFSTHPPYSDLQFEPYSATLHTRFAQLVDATYEDTLDCPAVNGVRHVDDVLQGYKATGHFNPERWFMVRHQGEDVGCLILTDYPDHATWELIYLGLSPAARGRGWGAGIVRHALWLAGQASRTRLVLTVDAANEPALRMYAAAGFQVCDRMSAYIRILDDKAPVE